MTKQALEIAIKITFITICFVLFFGGTHPPVFAQHKVYTEIVPVISAEDAVQDNNIQEINRHLQSTDEKLAEALVAINNSRDALAGIKGEERAIGLLLGILEIFSLVVHARKATD